MAQKNLILPFITKPQNQKEDLTFPAELACVACLAEWQRKKTGFLRDTPEKLAFVSKLYYPLWLVAAEDMSLMLDGLGLAAHKFTFKEPSKTGAFIENLEKNSANHQAFLTALDAETRKVSEFTSPVSVSFKALMSDQELLPFLQKYFHTGEAADPSTGQKSDLIHAEIDEDAAFETSRAITNCFRTLQADAKGLQYALDVLKEQVEFHRLAVSAEIEVLQEKCEAETAALRPVVDKAIKKLTQKHNKKLASLTKTNDRKVAALEKKRDRFLQKLQAAERKRDAAHRRVDAAKKKGTGKTGTYELKRYEREVGNLKKEINAVSDAIKQQKKEGEAAFRAAEEEHRQAVLQEENKLTAIQTACNAKTAKKKQEIETLASQAATITMGFKNIMDELKRSGASLRQQVAVDWEMDSPEDAVLVRVPMYMVKYLKEKQERYSLIAPLAISEEAGMLNGIRKILTFGSEPKMKTLTHPASKRLQEMLNANVLDRMQGDEVYKSIVTSMCRVNNLLDTMEFAETLNEGLDELVRHGWMSSEEASAACKRVMEANA